MTRLDRPDDLGPGTDELAGVRRDLEAYVRGTAHAMPPELLPRVLIAVAHEAPLTPPANFARAIAALAPRDAARAFGALLAVVGGRGHGGVGLRLRAAALVVATIVVLGSAAAGATIGGAQLVHGWLVTQAGPSPTATDLVSPTPVHSLHPATPAPADRTPHPSTRPSEGPHASAEPSEPVESAGPSEQDGDPSGDPGDDGPGGSGGGAHSPGPSSDD
ncbi:MAG TPA: hypothetical protein VID25_12125 [Candidatus Limnocylindrales bacterium]